MEWTLKLPDRKLDSPERTYNRKETWVSGYKADGLRAGQVDLEDHVLASQRYQSVHAK